MSNAMRMAAACACGVVRLGVAGALLVLFAAAPAMAQTANPGLAGIERMRLVLGLLSSDANRKSCNITPDLEQTLITKLRQGPMGNGVAIPEATRLFHPAAGHNVYVSEPNDRSLPLFFVSISALAVTVGQVTICSYAILAKVDTRVAGRAAATGRDLDQNVGVWNFDRLYSGTPDTFAPDLTSASESVGQELAAALRNAVPGKR